MADCRMGPRTSGENQIQSQILEQEVSSSSSSSVSGQGQGQGQTQLMSGSASVSVQSSPASSSAIGIGGINSPSQMNGGVGGCCGGSRSYHHQHHQPHHHHHHHSRQNPYQNLSQPQPHCHYYNMNGYPPPPPPMQGPGPMYGPGPPSSSPPPLPHPHSHTHPHPPLPPHHHLHHHHLLNSPPQYVGSSCGGLDQHLQQQQAHGHGHGHPHHFQEPPPRPWIQLTHSKHKRSCFTVLCYNILCSRYASPTLYSYCPGWALDWNYRRKAILQELIHYAPDIISLQEMETDQFYNFFLPQLQLLGYSGIFGAKSRARTMVESKRKLVDGCAIFYRTNKFRLLSEHLIEFSQVAMQSAHGRGEDNQNQFSEEMINRVQTKDNIALAALLETKLDSEHKKGLHGLVTPRSRPLLVCTCHIHWDPNFCDVKLVQAMMLMQELRKITDNIDLAQLYAAAAAPSPNPSQVSGPTATGAGEKRKASSSNTTTNYEESPRSRNTFIPKKTPNISSTSSSNNNSTTAPTTTTSTSSTLDKVHLLVCGDFNSLPQSGVVQFMETGNISCTHPDFKGLSYEDYLDSSTKLSPGRSDSQQDVLLQEPEQVPEHQQQQQQYPHPEEEFKHEFNLNSAYPPETMPFTNYTLEFQGVIDYIFHSVKGLRPLGILGPLDSSWLVQNNIVGAPHPCIPSDHLPLLVELEMIPAI